MFANTPPPPYYAVIFCSTLTDKPDGYETTAQRMIELAEQQDGFLGIESARDEIGISVSYWRDLTAIKTWKNEVEHLTAQQRGKDQWYKDFITRICLVERDYRM